MNIRVSGSSFQFIVHNFKIALINFKSNDVNEQKPEKKLTNRCTIGRSGINCKKKFLVVLRATVICTSNIKQSVSVLLCWSFVFILFCFCLISSQNVISL